VSVALFALLSVSLYSLLRTGIMARKKITAEQALFQDICFKLELLAKDLHNLVLFKPGDPQFPFLEGDMDSFEFITTAFDYRQALPVLRRVRYEFNDGALTKTISGIFAQGEEKTTDFITGIGGVSFFYFDLNRAVDKQWRDSWQKHDELPFGVRIELSWKGKGKKEYKVNKYVMLAK